MKVLKPWLAVAAIVIAPLVLAFAAGCRAPAPTAPTTVNVNVTNINTLLTGPAGVGDTGPNSGPVASCTINAFGVPIRKSGSGECGAGDKEIRVGCEQAVTLNPRDAQGNVIFNEQVTGTIPNAFGLAAGSDTSVAQIRTGSESAYNRFVQGLKPGILTFNGDVKGKTCSASFNVVP